MIWCYIPTVSLSDWRKSRNWVRMQSQSRLELNKSWYSTTQKRYHLCQFARPEQMVHIITTRLKVQRDSKRWTHFLSLYGLYSKRRLNTGQTVGCGIPSSLLALRVDLRGLRSKLSSIRLTFSSDTRGRPEHLPLHRQPICSNWWFQRQMLFLVKGWMLKRRRNARCTAVADSVSMNSRTQKILCCKVAILLSTDAAARLCARQAL